MKSLFCITAFLIFQTCFADISKYVEKEYGNVKVMTFTANYVEEMYKTLIIAQYAEMLSNKHNYKGQIEIFFHETLKESEFLFAGYYYDDTELNSDAKRILFLRFHKTEFCIIGSLNLIEYAILNQEIVREKKDELPAIYGAAASSVVKEVLRQKIYRPEEVKELERPDYFTYYFQNNQYHFVYMDKGTEKEVITLDKVVDFFVLNRRLQVVFTEKDEFIILQPKEDRITLKIENPDDFYRPYRVQLLGHDKITLEHSERSSQANRVLLYLLDRGVLIQDLDKVIDKHIDK